MSRSLCFILPVFLALALLAAPSPGCHPEPDLWPVLEKQT